MPFKPNKGTPVTIYGVTFANAVTLSRDLGYKARITQLLIDQRYGGSWELFAQKRLGIKDPIECAKKLKDLKDHPPLPVAKDPKGRLVDHDIIGALIFGWKTLAEAERGKILEMLAPVFTTSAEVLDKKIEKFIQGKK